MEALTMASATADFTVIDTIDNVTAVQDNQASGSASTVTSPDTPGPLTSTSTSTSATTVVNEEDARTVSLSARTSITVAQSMQMFNHSNHTELNNSVLSNVGGNQTNIIVHGNPIIRCSSTEGSATLRINSTKSSEALQDVTPSQPQHSSVLANSTEENGSVTGIQTGITTPRRVQRESSACENQPGYSGPRTSTQGKEDQQATPVADGDQTSKNTIDRITVWIAIWLTSTELKISDRFFFFLY
ncbi:hypothetical protein K435DRAFT_450190 [Dendrothele bispora CBS 962.96]|uniref:Uncharacterized protein n=1 Tax=Dendrothele bispora (strain CBS 962.96) TaxID=1314807 RepID=A0A4S8MU74_DENBC|nr:hypothetical protein K435DRAFT_450190 [Dendrothele bispora CBS 962.96]